MAAEGLTAAEVQALGPHTRVPSASQEGPPGDRKLGEGPEMDPPGGSCASFPKNPCGCPVPLSCNGSLVPGARALPVFCLVLPTSSDLGTPRSRHPVLQMVKLRPEGTETPSAGAKIPVQSWLAPRCATCTRPALSSARPLAHSHTCTHGSPGAPSQQPGPPSTGTVFNKQLKRQNWAGMATLLGNGAARTGQQTLHKH